MSLKTFKISLMLFLYFIMFCEVIAVESKTINYEGNEIKIDKLIDLNIDEIIERDSIYRSYSDQIGQIYSYFVIEQSNNVVLGFTTQSNAIESEKEIDILAFYKEPADKIKLVRTNSIKLKNWSKYSSNHMMFGNDVCFFNRGKLSGFTINQDLNIENKLPDFPKQIEESKKVLEKYNLPMNHIKNNFIDTYGYFYCSDSLCYIDANNELFKVNTKTQILETINIKPFIDYLKKFNNDFDMLDVVGIVNNKIILIDIHPLKFFTYDIKTQKVSTFWSQNINRNFDVGRLYKPEPGFSSYNYFATMNNLYCIIESKTRVALFRIDISNM